MRPTRVSLSAVGYTPPVLLDWYQVPPVIGLAVTLSSGADLTANVYYSLDDLSSAAQRVVAGISRSGTTITVVGDLGLTGNATDSGDGGTHGLSVGDFVQIVNDPTLNGSYEVASVVSATSYTLTSPVSGTYSAPNPVLVSARLFEVTGLSALAARTAASLAVPATAVWLNVSAYTSGVATLAVTQGEQS